MSSETFQQTRAIKELTQAVKHLGKTMESVGSTNVMNVSKSTAEYHDDQTMDKVRRVLMNSGSITKTPDDLIADLINAGILFRERR